MFVEVFWRKYPSLLYGLACLLSCFAVLKPTWWLALPILILFGPLFFVSIRHPLALRLLLAIALFVAQSYAIQSNYKFPVQAQEGISGLAHFHIESLTNGRHPFGKQWIYKVTIRHFYSDNNGGRGIPCKLIVPDKPDFVRPPADCDYCVRGRLKSFEKGGFLLKVAKDEPWYPVQGSFSLAEKRYHAKAALCKAIQNHISDPHSQVFLSGIVTGEFDDRLMQHEFGRFGLQHIMAISGFHFAIIAAIFNLILRLFLKRKAATVALLVILTSYYLFLGNSPSIMRAWIACMAGLLGVLWEKQGSGLNALGLGLMLVLILDPLLSLHIGFQYSFAATGAILLLYADCDRLLQRLWAKRKLSEALLMDRFDQHGLLLLTLIRQGVALSLAVNLVTMPMVLYHFHKFPLMSFLYNLFFPAMVSLAMLLLIIGLIAGWLVVPVGAWIHAINNHYTRWMLDFTYQMPPSVDKFVRIDHFPSEVLILYLTLIAVWVVYRRSRVLNA